MGRCNINYNLFYYYFSLCCLCSATIEANMKGMCNACVKAQTDITEGITKFNILNYCKNCDRYSKPPLIRCELESSEMMALCLSKIKGLNKVKLVDSSFIWTEPHSKIIKLKLTIQREVNNVLYESSFIAEFRVEWFMCDECQKSFTPHKWTAAVQVRQKNNNSKKTFLLLEQIILKHRLHKKMLEVKELNDGCDFYFLSKSQAQTFVDFLHTILPIKVKQSKQLISHDQNSNTFNYKYTFSVDIAPITKDDLIFLQDKEVRKNLGGVASPLLLCTKLATRIQFLDPFSMKVYEFDEHTFWKYNFKSFIDKHCLEEFLIINVEEEIDYKQLNNNSKINKNESLISVTSDSKESFNNSKSTYHKMALNLTSNNNNNNSKREIKSVTVQCIFNNRPDDTEMITVKSHLGKKIKPGDIYLGYNLLNLNANNEFDNINSTLSDKIPDVILLKKKYEKNRNKKRKWKLKHLDNKHQELANANNSNSKSKKLSANDDYEKHYEEFLEDIERDDEIRKHMDLYKGNLEQVNPNTNTIEKALEDEDNDVSETDIKVDELLEDLDLNDEQEDALELNKYENEEEEQKKEVKEI